MMNNQFNATNLAATTQPHHNNIQMAQHVVTSPPSQSQAAVLNTFYNGQQQQQPHSHHHHQQQQQQQQQQLAVATAGGLYADPRQLQLSANTLDKAYYTTAAATLGTPQRFYTTASGTPIATPNCSAHNTATHPNTILITNNFTHQQQPQSPEQQRMSAALNSGNIRIVTSSANPSNLAGTNGGTYHHAQHVFNVHNSKGLQLLPQHMLQQQQQNFQHAPELITQHFSPQHFPVSQNVTNSPPPQTAAAIQMPQYYMAAESSLSQLPPNPKILTSIPLNNVASSATTMDMPTGTTNANNSSTVVLDRINICINNLYTDTSSSSASNSLTSTPAQQPSPIIPAIQHKAVIDNGPLVSTGSGDFYESSVLVIDEPDSTTTATTPHTPPTTPENIPFSLINNANAASNTITTTSTISSPSTSSTTVGQLPDIHLTNGISTTKQNFAAVAQHIEDVAGVTQDSILNITPQQTNSGISCQALTSMPQNTPLTPPTPPSPEMMVKSKQADSNLISPTTTMPPPEPLFANGEDVFIKLQDGRFYLGTVIEAARNQFLVRFDDKTEQWCNAEEMKKLGGGSSNSNSSSQETSQVQQAMCVACKQQQPESKVEICERCGRGYHRKCTMETTTGSGIWLCKRCDKPMQLDINVKPIILSDDEEDVEDGSEVCRQLSYDLASLTWDSKHRVNEEQTYCYCGKTGKFDQDMLQCCRCLNWYHIQCSQKFKGNLLRGDSFFVFSCSVCNDGGEYLRRLELEWVDLVHLIIYNLSTLKKHQNHKYHHLLKDIYPFALEKRNIFPIPQEWLLMPENDFLNKIKATLKDNSERFVCGKEIKRDHYFFALRTNGPPISKNITIKPNHLLNDDFIVNNLKLKLLKGAPENVDAFLAASTSAMLGSEVHTTKDSSSHDVYEFDDTSDDEMPIKLMLDKVKKKNKSSENLKESCAKTSINKTTLEKMDVEDDNANDLVITQTPQDYSTDAVIVAETKIENLLAPTIETKSPIPEANACIDENIAVVDKNVLTANIIKPAAEKSSRKRKAFTSNKSYDKQRLIDTSSDENSSSSSRGTSLDLIIPPPKNFLGQNNPFLVVTPKKKTGSPGGATSSSGGKKSVSFSIFSTSGLNFSSKLAALKSAGYFPKLSTSNLAKAAGQPRTVRTIKRRLSAKDITIGPNQEVRRRRTRRLSANIEVISTTTINPIPTNFFPIHAKDLLAAAAASTTAASFFTTQTKNTFSTPLSSSSLTTSTTAATSNVPTPKQETIVNAAASSVAPVKPIAPPTHGRRLRQRPPKSSPNTSRRNSVSSNQSSTSSSATSVPAIMPQQPKQNAHQSQEDLKQTVNKYFGIVNRIEAGEQFSIRAKRQLANGTMQFLIEWGGEQTLPPPPPPSPAQSPAKENTAAQIITDLEPKSSENIEAMESIDNNLDATKPCNDSM